MRSVIALSGNRLSSCDDHPHTRLAVVGLRAEIACFHSVRVGDAQQDSGKGPMKGQPSDRGGNLFL